MPVSFDVGSRKVLFADRICKSPGGVQFRYHCYNPLINAMEQVIRERHQGTLGA